MAGMRSVSAFRTLLAELSTSLQAFQTSTKSFSVLYTIYGSGGATSLTLPTPATQDGRRLLILDSSFNPPSKAHFHLARSALCEALSPRHLLLLFSVHNADKAPSAASFSQRLTMMVLLGHDIAASFETSANGGAANILQADPSDKSQSDERLRIDIGVTTKPYYSDKTAAIEESKAYQAPDASSSPPPHTHILGYDTLIRFMNAKYYQDYSPPLSALSAYFDANHALRAALRPGDEFGDIAEQQAFVQGIRDGKLEKDGGKREWADLIELVEVKEGQGISSTQVRKAAEDERWNVVEEMCTDRVAAAVKEERIYAAR